MTRTLVRGGIVALTLFAVVLAADLLGFEAFWPFVLAAAVGLAAGRELAGRFGAFAGGAALGWVGFAIRAGFLPDVAVGHALGLVIAVLATTVLAAATGDRLPLWAGLAGVAAFLGLYGPIYDDTPTTFLTDSPTALVTIVLSAALAAIAVTVSDVAAPRATTIVIPDGEPQARSVAIPDTEQEVR